MFSPSAISRRDIFIVRKGVLLSDHSWSHAKRPGLDALRIQSSADTHVEGSWRVGPVTSVSSILVLLSVQGPGIALKTLGQRRQNLLENCSSCCLARHHTLD